MKHQDLNHIDFSTMKLCKPPICVYIIIMSVIICINYMEEVTICSIEKLSKLSIITGYKCNIKPLFQMQAVY